MQISESWTNVLNVKWTRCSAYEDSLKCHPFCKKSDGGWFSNVGLLTLFYYLKLARKVEIQLLVWSSLVYIYTFLYSLLVLTNRKRTKNDSNKRLKCVNSQGFVQKLLFLLKVLLQALYFHLQLDVLQEIKAESHPSHCHRYTSASSHQHVGNR